MKDAGEICPPVAPAHNLRRNGAFIKQPKERVSFPRTRCQLLPISPAPGRGYRSPSLLGTGAAEVQAPRSKAWIQLLALSHQ
ncbi:hypothetical protein WMY93_028501 [Mugilogobius chulae]|uniref:Uncharacterized protein n=1 Tax=Mugilogobius chulae TaxID=88201 RepID=A0AAW0MT51_9GOBI